MAKTQYASISNHSLSVGGLEIQERFNPVRYERENEPIKEKYRDFILTFRKKHSSVVRFYYKSITFALYLWQKSTLSNTA